MELKGRVALITGASSGIGWATSLALGDAGVRLALAARRRDRLTALVDQVRARGSEALILPTDMRDEEAVRRMVAATHEQYGRLDILINNAGLGWFGPIIDGKTAEWREMLETNLLGLLWATREALRLMIPQRSGHIVNISSIAGRRTLAGMGVYSATKFGVIAVSEALRQEVYDHHIRVTVIEPGIVETEFIDRIPPQALERFRGVTPLQAEDVARTILWALRQPPHVDVFEVVVRPTNQGGP